MKIMGRVARLILLVVVSPVCAVFCVLCCLQNNPVFSSVTYLNIKKLTRSPDRRLKLFFFPVVMKISRQNKKTANFPPERKTDTPARQTTGTFLFSGRNENFPPQQKNCQFPARTKNWHTRQTDDWNFFFPVVMKISHLYLFFPVVIDRVPARQTTGTFFFRS